ncbi:PadR family transcriptional regulator [Bacillus litorisediminis]|uniref:PadR family transcriptional regulator n=2 Tax=Bacillus litorisediminis TaxID=2922713 RepID=UPI001FAB6D4A|nr:PadR family transcriptional regulator [Bacillus litorisediminis]
MAKENYTKYVLLGMLTTKCRTGYAIKQMIDQSISHFWKISYGQIYPNLKKLVEEGLATVEDTSQEGLPDKKEYQITEKGKQVLQAWLQEPISIIPTEKNELLLKLFFSRHQAPDSAIKQISFYKEKLQDRLNTYIGIETMIRTDMEDAEDAMFWLMTLDYGQRTTKAILEWCEVSIEKLLKKK